MNPLHSDAVRIRHARSDLGHLVGTVRALLNGDIQDGPVLREALDSLCAMAEMRLDALRLIEQVLLDPGLAQRREQAMKPVSVIYTPGDAIMDRGPIKL